MNKNKISHLLQRFLEAHKNGTEPYFDANEVEELLDSMEVSNDYTYYDEILALGLKLHPESLDLKIKQCQSLLYYEEYDRALKYVKTLTDHDNEELDTLRMECYCMNNMYNSVKQFTTQLMNDDCDYLKNIIYYTTSTLNENGMYTEAIDYIKRGFLVYPDDPYLKDEYCYSLEMTGDIDRAITICNEMIDVNPYSFDSWLNLGHLYSLNEQYEKAIEAFDFALTCDSKRVEEVNLMKGYCLYMNESYLEAINIYEHLHVDDPLVMQHIRPVLAECYIHMENFEKAYPILKSYLEEYDKFDDPDFYLHYFFCCINLDKENDGMKVLSEGAKIYPDNIKIMTLLIIAYLKKKDNSKAQEIMNELLTLINSKGDETQDEINEISEIKKLHFTKNELKSAFKHFNKLLDTYPNVPFTDMLATFFYLNKKAISLAKLDTTQIPLFTSTLSHKKEYYKNLVQKLDTTKQESKHLIASYLNNKGNNN